MGLTKELQVGVVADLLASRSHPLLPSNLQLLPYDYLFKWFSEGVPPKAMVAVPMFEIKEPLDEDDEEFLGYAGPAHDD